MPEKRDEVVEEPDPGETTPRGRRPTPEEKTEDVEEDKIDSAQSAHEKAKRRKAALRGR